jgi:hypothetical protein
VWERNWKIPDIFSISLAHFLSSADVGGMFLGFQIFPLKK